MNETTNLLCRILDALRESQVLHELSHRIGGELVHPEDYRRCQAILAEHASLAIDIENAIRDALLPKRERAVA